MKILMLSRLYYPHIGGVEKHVEKVSRELIKRGHQVTVLTLKHDAKLTELETRRGVKIIRIPYSNSKWTIWKNILMKSDMFKKADIIHCHDVFFWYLPLRFIFPKKPNFTTFHGWEGKFPVPKKNILIRKLSEKLSRGNICVGDYLKKWYLTNPNLVTYGAHSFTTRDRAPQINASKLKECIFIGRLDKDTGIKEYLKVLKQIKKNYGFKITFVGDGAYKAQAQKIGQVTGFVKNITSYLKKPSFIFASSYLTILEAMASQRPVFALYQNQLKKDYLTLFPGSSFIKISGSSNDLIKQFETAVKTPQLIDKMVAKAYHYAKKQTWQKVADQYTQLWKL